MIVKNDKGFTLIELLVVMAMLGVLISVFLIIINPAVQFQKTRDAERKSDLAQIQKALESYYNDYKSYPQSSPSYMIVSSGITLSWGSQWTPYMQTLPKDPTTPARNYVYVASGNNPQSYQLYASLERGANDPQACNDHGNPPKDSFCPGVPANLSCGASNLCDYGVSSSNVSP